MIQALAFLLALLSTACSSVVQRRTTSCFAMAPHKAQRTSSQAPKAVPRRSQPCARFSFLSLSSITTTAAAIEDDTERDERGMDRITQLWWKGTRFNNNYYYSRNETESSATATIPAVEEENRVAATTIQTLSLSSSSSQSYGCSSPKALANVNQRPTTPSTTGEKHRTPA
jgi:hypothetical protein